MKLFRNNRGKMKKICAFFCCFAALFLLISCGSSGSSRKIEEIGNYEKNTGELGGECYINGICNEGLNCDKDNNICVEDPAYPIDDLDTGSEKNDDKTDTNSDNTDSAPNGGNSISDEDLNDSGDATDDSDPADSTSDVDSGVPEDFPVCSPTSQTPCIDQNTLLVWSAKSPEQKSWIDAVKYCKSLEEGGYSDWNLPDINLLATLIRNCDSNEGCAGNSDGKYSIFGDTTFLWSYTGGSSKAKGIDFYNASVQSKSSDEVFYFRCTRISVTSIEGECSTIPENAVYNTVSKITLTWDWANYWMPSQETTYNEEPSTTECRFKCDTNYFWDSDSELCVNPCKSNPCDSFTGFTDKVCVAYNYEQYSCGGKDSSSKLRWSTKAVDPMDWNSAVSYCDGLTEGGYSDWRLPNISELRTLVRNCNDTETGGSCGVIDTGNSSTTCLSYNECRNDACDGCTSDSSGYYSKFGESSWFWSSSTLSTHADYAWLLGFYNARVSNLSKTYVQDVRCVRSE